MRIILSRKGIDSGVGSGRMASPILPCGCLCSIPIPYKQGIPYSDIQFGSRTVQQIIMELNPSWSHSVAHLDPDLRFDALASRPKGWRPAFGQSGAAAGHLVNQDVGVDDLFIFFGWFRMTKKTSGRLIFDPADIHGRHIVFGWLEVGRLVDKSPPPSDLLFLVDPPTCALFRRGNPSEQDLCVIRIGVEGGCILDRIRRSRANQRRRISFVLVAQ